MRRPILLLIVLSMLAAACPAGEPERVRIGVAAPLSGPRASLGTDVRRGAELAVEDLNADGGLLGEEVELVVRDTADLIDLPGTVSDLVERSRITALIGPEAPGVILGERSPLTRRDVPALLPTAFAGDLDTAASTVLRTVPSARAQSEALGRWLTAERAIGEVAVLVVDPVEGSGARQAVEHGLEAGGARVAAVVEADPDAPDLGPAIASLRASADEAGALLLWGPPTSVARATRAVRQQRWDVQVAVPATAFVGEYRSLAGTSAEGVVLPFPFREDWFSATMEDWMVRWHQRHRIEAVADLDTLVLDLPVVALAAYDAVGIVAEAVRAAGSAEPAEVASALREIRAGGLLRDYTFGDDGEAWDERDLHVARFHHVAVVFDADAGLDPEEQRRFWEYQTRLEYLPDEIGDGAAADLVRELIERRRDDAPEYEPPLPPPDPVGRPEEADGW
jgi:branched-chain amino acid transport system substrate-binding protein